MTLRTFVLIALVALSPALPIAQTAGGLNPADILKPLGDSWPTYNGDYSGRHYSSLAQINQTNVKNLTLAWVSRLAGGAAGAIVGGEGTGEFAAAQAVSVKGAILEVDGVLYVSTPDNAWAVDARDGRVIWHYFWKTRGGTHIGNRGLGMWHNYLYMETPDDYLVSLDARTGKERWHVEIASFNQQYFSTMAPIVVGDRLIVGTGNDLDAPGFLQAFDPETGKLIWKFYTVPMNPGDPGLETWPSLDAARHGGAHTWIPGAYDPETKLYIFGTGNPTPAYTNGGRQGDNLFSCSLVAVNVETGKMAWYYQTSPHDTHDWDSTQTPALVDAPLSGRMRKLVLQATRNGYFFTLDRVTGEHLVTSRFGDAANWAIGLDEKGQPRRDPRKDPTIPGALVSPTNAGTTNWFPIAYSPQTELFYVPQHNAYAMYYLNDPDPRGAMGLGGKTEVGVGTTGDFLTAIDYKNGTVVWRHKFPGGGGAGPQGTGLLATAGRLLFSHDASGNLVAFNPANGKILWHTQMGMGTNAPETYMIDGHQYILAVAGDQMFAFTLY